MLGWRRCAQTTAAKSPPKGPRPGDPVLGQHWDGSGRKVHFVRIPSELLPRWPARSAVGALCSCKSPCSPSDHRFTEDPLEGALSRLDPVLGRSWDGSGRKVLLRSPFVEPFFFNCVLVIVCVLN